MRSCHVDKDLHCLWCCEHVSMNHLNTMAEPWTSAQQHLWLSMFCHFLAYIELPLQKCIKYLSSHKVHYQTFIVYPGKDIAILFYSLVCWKELVNEHHTIFSRIHNKFTSRTKKRFLCLCNFCNYEHKWVTKTTEVYINVLRKMFCLFYHAM